VVRAGEQKKELKPKQDFVPFSFSASGTVQGPLVFAGYGVSADEFQYDDYAGIDVKNKIVVVLRYEPASFAAKTGNHGLTQHSSLISKAINARNHGAKALVLVNGKLGDGEEDLLTRFGSVSGPENVGIVFVQVKNAVAEEWLKAAGKSLPETQEKINNSGKPQSFTLPANQTASIKVSIVTTRATVNNVLAYLPGKTDEYVIIGAHYDHLGRGNFDSLAPSQIGQIHPGADDNASGTAGVLELARLLAPQKGQLRRGVLFMSFAGEELGLLGSAEWVKEPTRPLEKAVAMLNMDMIGRVRDGKLYIGAVATGSTFRPMLDGITPKHSLKIDYSNMGEAGGSDHTSFLIGKVPSLFFFSGLHSDYHKPSDTWDKIDAPDAAKVLELVADIAGALRETSDRPQFVRVAPPSGHGEGNAGPVSSSSGSGYGPYFGSIPDFGEGVKGVKFADVRDGSPASKAGFKAGDIMVEFDGKPIQNLYDFTYALQAKKPGDEVLVKVMRDGKPLEATVGLTKRQ
jgi:hypothetical protein